MSRSKARSWKTLFIALVAVLTISMLAACGKKDDNKGKEAANNGSSGKVVATYEGGEITENEFDLELRIMKTLQPQMAQLLELDDFREFLVKQAITYEYLSGKADDKAQKEGKKTAEDQLKAIKTQMGDEAFKQMLDTQKITEDELKNYMVRIFTVVASQTAGITEEDIKTEFEATKDDYTTASVRHILIGLTDAEGKERSKEDALKLANEVKAKLDKGEDFATLAKEYSEDPGSKDNGGLYEDALVTQWVPQFQEKARTLKINEISNPVETDYGYHIMRVESRTEKKYEDLTAEEKDMIKNLVGSNKLDEFMDKDLDKIIKKIDLPKVENNTETDNNAATPPASEGNAGTDSQGTSKESGNSGNAGANNSEKTDGNAGNTK
ncbi:peptidylprolyl isomerase [Paenibacillus sp. FSL W8-0186]|uniref:Peptidylprolyl isomerase n=1 Tax=Paenibacillus woosongensis TaxID=307580 RepID=A0ABQ4MZH1_9BACL|nr:peptidylprolyl isomerase [Paenibacillus woosongensis]GIP61276.1 peptidylprolyl isomerase [Paenibacillus woosongensis]